MGRAVQVKLTVVRLLLYCLTYFFIFRSYYWFAGVMNQVIDLHFWFLDICWGIFGVTYAKVFMDKVMPLIIVPLKMIELASIATDSVSIRECGSTVMKKFGQVSIIVTVNALLRVVLNKAYDKLEADWFKRLYDRLKQSKVKSIVNFAENVLYTITDNIDFYKGAEFLYFCRVCVLRHQYLEVGYKFCRTGILVLLYSAEFTA